jgi:hypothetical protein
MSIEEIKRLFSGALGGCATKKEIAGFLNIVDGYFAPEIAMHQYEGASDTIYSSLVSHASRIGLDLNEADSRALEELVTGVIQELSSNAADGW